MIQVIRQSTHVARKKHYDSGYEYIQDFIGDSLSFTEDVTVEEANILREWRKDPNKMYIMPGMTYVSQFSKQDGEVFTFKMRKELFDIACKYKLWELYE